MLKCRIGLTSPNPNATGARSLRSFCSGPVQLGWASTGFSRDADSGVLDRRWTRTWEGGTAITQAEDQIEAETTGDSGERNEGYEGYGDETEPKRSSGIESRSRAETTHPSFNMRRTK